MSFQGRMDNAYAVAIYRIFDGQNVLALLSQNVGNISLC